MVTMEDGWKAQSRMENMEEIYMGYITSARCRECGKDTFAADEVCYTCKEEMAESDRLYFLGLKTDCE